MSKELTEKWKNGELPDDTYYIRCVDVGDNYISCNEEEYEKIDTYSGFDEHFIETNNDEIVEVLAPVPSYEEYRELLDLNVYEKDRKKVMGLEDKVERLQEQLSEANELLKAYGTESLWESLSLSCDEANEYCKKWGVK